MACNCNKAAAVVPLSPGKLPYLADLYPPVTVEEAAGCPATAIASTPSDGAILATALTDAAPLPVGETATILARKGSRLFRFTGSGFLQIIDGLAKVVKSVPLRATSLWHEWWESAGLGKKPILGAPLPYPTKVVADTEGNLHLVQGIQGSGITRDSVEVWNQELKQWEIRDVADFPALQKGRINQASEIELTGFQPIVANGQPDEVRPRVALTGEGIFRVKKVATVAAETCGCEGCAQVPAFSYVTEFIPDPVDEGSYSLKITIDEEGVKTYAWVADS